LSIHIPDGINDSPSIASLELCSASTKDTRTGEDGHFHFSFLFSHSGNIIFLKSAEEKEVVLLDAPLFFPRGGK
jgi:hypothetical protein